MTITYKPKVSNSAMPAFMKLKRSINPFTYHTMPFINWLIDNPEFSNPEKVSVIYLASFQDYNGKLVSGNRVPLNKKMIQEKTGIKCVKTFNKFYKKLFSQDIFNETESGELYWNNLMSLKRGMYGTQKHEELKLVKIFDKQLHQLYSENVPKTLYPIIALAPYTTPIENKVDLSMPMITFNCCYSNTRSCGRQLQLMMLESGEQVFVKRNEEIFINPNLIKF